MIQLENIEKSYQTKAGCTAENLAAGMAPEEAAREARKRFGNLQGIREECREARGASFGVATLRDVRFGLRMLRKNRGFTAIAVLTLALCLGANLAIFAVVDSVLLRPLPFPEADRLVSVHNTYPQAGIERPIAPFANYYEHRDSIPAFSHISILRYDMAIVGEAGSTRQEDVTRVSPEFFITLGIGPILGPAFTEEEMIPQADGVRRRGYK